MRRNTYNYGVLPPYEVFEEYFDENVGSGRFRIRLGRTDSRAADGTNIGDGEYTPEDLYEGLQQLVAKGGDAALDLASSILAALGFEWI